MISFPRATGILLHPTSFPSRGGIGDFGPAAYEFADFLASARQGLWQVLPLGPPANGNSPYSSTSAFAGNPLLISLERLAERGWKISSCSTRCGKETNGDAGRSGPVLWLDAKQRH
jgi:4-alpha-glucanotransferase